MTHQTLVLHIWNFLESLQDFSLSFFDLKHPQTVTPFLHPIHGTLMNSLLVIVMTSVKII